MALLDAAAAAHASLDGAEGVEGAERANVAAGVPPCAFDPYVALCGALLGPEGAAPFLEQLSAHQSSVLLWPALRQGAPSGVGPCGAAWGEALLESVAEQIVALELPLLAQAMRRAGVTPSLPIARWLRCCWLNVLPWRALLAAFVLPMLLGADLQIYLCVAALRSLEQPALRCAHSADLLVLVLQPLPAFDPETALPYMLALRRKHGGLYEQQLSAELLGQRVGHGTGASA